jgi:hypothetical protein
MLTQAMSRDWVKLQENINERKADMTRATAKYLYIVPYTESLYERAMSKAMVFGLRLFEMHKSRDS